MIRVDKVIPHPDFNPMNFEHDIALIRFTEPVAFSRDLFPVCLPDPVNGIATTDYSGESAIVNGWGCQEEECNFADIPTLLQETQIPVITNELAMCW